MSDTQIDELTLLTALECLIASTQLEGNKVCRYDELTDAMDFDNLSVEGLDVVVAIKQLRKWISDFIIKITFYIRKTVTKMTSQHVGDQTVKTLQARFDKLKNLDDVSPVAQRHIKSNVAMFVAWDISMSNGLGNILGADSSLLTLSDVNKSLTNAGLPHVKFEVSSSHRPDKDENNLNPDTYKGEDIVNGVTIRSAVGNKLSLAYFTEQNRYGILEIDCSDSRRLKDIVTLLQDFRILSSKEMDKVYDRLEKHAKSMSNALTDNVDKNMSDAEIKNVRAELGFGLSVIIKQVSLIKNMNDFLIKTARMIGE